MKQLEEKWIRKYLKLAKVLADDNSACYSRKIGVILVSEHNRIISGGYNTTDIPHPDSTEYLQHVWTDLLNDQDREYLLLNHNVRDWLDFAQFSGKKQCPRKLLGCKSGERLELCPCGHAERNALASANLHGVSTYNSTIYCFCGIPCHECTIQLIQAGVKRVVCLKKDKDYSSSSRWNFFQAGVEVVEVPEEIVQDT
jgi:deoxycytidylate deaminase